MVEFKLISIVSIVLFLCVSVGSTPLPEAQTLKFREDGTFKVLFLADLHFGWSDDLDFTTQKTMTALLEAEKPDFVAIGGDVVSNDAPGPRPKPASWITEAWGRAVDPLHKAGVPWGVVLGNHDLFYTLNDYQIAAFDASFLGSYTSPENDVSYVLKLMDASETHFLTNLFFFNTHAYGCLDVPNGSGCVTLDAVDWYKNMSAQLTLSQEGKVPGMAFMHIPPQEMISVFNNNNWFGNALDKDGICCSAANTGLIANMMAQNNINVVSFGHDHGNDYFGAYTPTLTLAYGRKTGAGGYHSEGISVGARTYLLSTNSESAIQGNLIYSGKTPSGQPLSITSWITLESGEKITQSRGTLTDKIGICCQASVN